MASHFGVAIMPARVRKPKDKAKAEGGVLLVTRWILACLRREVFYTLAQLNQRISALLVRLNQKAFQKIPGSRASQFEALDRAALKSLPRSPYIFMQIKTVKVHLDYHVEIERNYYSVPYALVKKSLQAHFSEGTVRLYHEGQCVAHHVRLFTPGKQSTDKEHMPVCFRW